MTAEHAEATARCIEEDTVIARARIRERFGEIGGQEAGTLQSQASEHATTANIQMHRTA